jgi:hypothetical protein
MTYADALRIDVKRGHPNMCHGRRNRLTAPNCGLEGLLTTDANPRVAFRRNRLRRAKMSYFMTNDRRT